MPKRLAPWSPNSNSCRTASAITTTRGSSASDWPALPTRCCVGGRAPPRFLRWAVWWPSSSAGKRPEAERVLARLATFASPQCQASVRAPGPGTRRRVMRVVAVWTIKGGVGKTAAAVNLAALAAAEGGALCSGIWTLRVQPASTFGSSRRSRVEDGSCCDGRPNSGVGSAERISTTSTCCRPISRIAALTSTSMAAGVLPNGSLSSLPHWPTSTTRSFSTALVGVAGE